MTKVQTPRQVLSVAALAALDAEAQSKYCTNIVGSDVDADEIEGLLYLAEEGKGPHTSMWAVLALGRAQEFYLDVVPELSELLERPSNTGRFRANLAETISKLPGAVWHVGILHRHYTDDSLATEYRGVIGCAIARIFSDANTPLAADSAANFIGAAIGDESGPCAVLRYLIEGHVHDSTVEAALKALLQHPKASFAAARPAVEKAAGCRHSESIAKAGKAVLARF